MGSSASKQAAESTAPTQINTKNATSKDKIRSVSKKPAKKGLYKRKKVNTGKRKQDEIEKDEKPIKKSKQVVDYVKPITRKQKDLAGTEGHEERKQDTRSNIKQESDSMIAEPPTKKQKQSRKRKLKSPVQTSPAPTTRESNDLTNLQYQAKQLNQDPLIFAEHVHAVQDSIGKDLDSLPQYTNANNSQFSQTAALTPAPISNVFPPAGHGIQQSPPTPEHQQHTMAEISLAEYQNQRYGPPGRPKRRVLFSNPIPALPPSRNEQAYSVLRTPIPLISGHPSLNSQLILSAPSPAVEVYPYSVHDERNYDYIFTCKCGHKFVTKGNINRHLKTLRFDEEHAKYVHPENELFVHIFPRNRLKKQEYEALRYKKQAEVDATTALAAMSQASKAARGYVEALQLKQQIIEQDKQLAATKRRYAQFSVEYDRDHLNAKNFTQ
ncbi:hypothetical protein V1512DRAFT_266095 [Lipomyces arxii]|uniref:uncharacterized protein n=1 Tax=Lipomyces arxii TaxID=56418 RepID=UPI0034CF2C85